jgi:DNA-binding beta-propeller fold protein YncE
MRGAQVADLAGCVLLATSAWAAAPVLTKVEDVALPGKPTRFDYQSFDPGTKRLYVSHMGDGELVVVDTRARRIVAHLPGFPTVTGVLVVPAIHRVFASVAGSHEVVVVDTESLEVVARTPAGKFPDGLAYSPETGKVFVSDERGGKETVIDGKSGRGLGTIDMGGQVGNTQYDAGSQRILANVQSKNEIVIIDPVSQRIVERHRLEGGDSPHGLLILAKERLAFAACEGDSKLLVVDLETFGVLQVLSTGEGPDVLAFDPGLARLYVATESHVVSVFRLNARTLEKLEDLRVAPEAHSVSVDPETHEVFLPLENVDGRPVLRIMKPSEP